MRFALIVFSLAVCPAQLQQPSFRTEVRLINVGFTVRDVRGVPVKDLTKDDVEVLDDGGPQSIAFFSRSDELPLALGLLADSSGSQEHFLKRHKHDLKEFLKAVLRPSDRAFLVCFGNRLRLASDFSASAAEILDGLKEFEDRPSQLPVLGPRHEIRILGTAFYDAIYYAATEKLASADHARKGLMVFSDGEDNSSAHHMLEAIEAAQRENVPVYGVRYTETKRHDLNARNKYGIGVMARIGRETGGADYDAERTDLKSAFRAISEELRWSYELAYHANDRASDGTFHKVLIRVKRPGVTVRAKTGYFAGDLR